jgi:hypothetical protein
MKDNPKILEIPATIEQKARINNLFNRGLITYDLINKKFIWPLQEIIFGGGEDYSLN